MDENPSFFIGEGDVMSKIIVVGLGPGGFQYLTMNALKVLTMDQTVYLRTDRHPVVEDLVNEGMTYESYDHIYDKMDTFDEVYRFIADDVMSKSDKEDVIYAVPGNPFVAEKTVELISQEANAKGIDVEYVHGASFVDAMITTLKKDPVHGMNIVDGLTMRVDQLNISVDQMVIQVYNPQVASQVKINLMERYPDEHEILVVTGAGIPGVEKVDQVPLYMLDQVEGINHLTSLYVPSYEEGVYSFYDLVEIMQSLRSEEGCPWDIKQTHQSLKKNLIEECYELIDAIDELDDDAMIEELGDVLLQVVFHTTIAQEDGYFNMDDVTTEISNKLIRRHPHIFGDVEVEDAEEVLENWEAIKRDEKEETYIAENLMRLPKHMPSIMRAEKIQKKVKEVGFDWDDVNPALDKVVEELNEIKEALKENDQHHAQHEVGDLFFAVVNVARFLGINGEEALNNTNQKFIERFYQMEQLAENRDLSLSKMDLKSLDLLWEEAKNTKK